ncbi:MAG: PAS domain S-box protein, partial [Actinomycetota bacterium]
MERAMKETQWLLEVLEAMPDGVVIVNRQGEMVLVNREIERLLGYDREDLLGKRVELLLPGNLATVHVGHREQFAKDAHRRSMGHGLDLVARRSDGSVFPVEISLAPAEIAGETVVIATVRDVTLNRQTDSDLAAARQRVMLA